MQSRKQALNILVVDDSAVVRQMMTTILSQCGMTVTVAANPLIALDKMKHSRFDVILLDLEMPKMDGLSFLRKIMAEDPLPVVVCSGVAGRGTDAAIAALEEGAVEVITKPKLGLQNFLQESAMMLADSLRAAALARLPKRRTITASTKTATLQTQLPSPSPSPINIIGDRVVAIGASTGGTEAIRALLEVLPIDIPGLVIVQHMPENFTAAFARRLNQLCRIEVKEAQSGDQVIRGRALIAPGNRHLRLLRCGARYSVELNDGPPVSRHRPSVDVLFNSVAQAAGAKAVGVILTGMGSDGAEGMLAMKKSGAVTIAQDEASCVVFGMPREAIIKGAVDEIHPLSRIAAAILKRVV